jgi:hypothetical protein
MTVPARRARASLAESDEDFDDEFAAGEFYSGERVCLPPDGAGGIGLLRGAILILIALGGGWALLTYQATWRPWLAAELAAVAPVIDTKVPAPLEAASAAVPAPLPAATTIPTMQLAAVAPPPPAPPAETPSAATKVTIAPAADAPIQQLPPPTVDLTDPYQKRAAAVGLHPDLSRVLLARLSPTDYRNAGVAIATAVAKTPDTATFVWPRQRTPELALFQVHFVPGAAPHCRRYVVTVTKDRWSTTAPPMEKCGTNLAGGKSK